MSDDHPPSTSNAFLAAICYMKRRSIEAKSRLERIAGIDLEDSSAQADHFDEAELTQKRQKYNERIKLIRNEQAKITATYSNNIAVAFFAVAALSSFLSMMKNSAGTIQFLLESLIIALALILSIIFHTFARWFLKGLK